MTTLQLNPTVCDILTFFFLINNGHKNVKILRLKRENKIDAN